MRNIREVRYKQLTLGHLSRNKFWGEDPDTQYHSVVASSVLLQDGEHNILVDPTLPVEEMERRLMTYCGLDRSSIDIVFSTHFHTDHRVDAEKYPNAKLYMSEESVQEVADLRVQGGPMAEIFLNGAVFDFRAAPRQLTDNICVQPLPGHTLGNAGLVFISGGKRILLSGDTIMNPEYYMAREGYFIDASQEKTVASMEWARQNVDIIIPGHGDCFFADLNASQKLSWRKLNLYTNDGEPAVLVQVGEENILINPILPGPTLRDALYDARGLNPSQITRVICMKNDPQHTLDLPIMDNAVYYLPEEELRNSKNGARLAFSAWEKTPQLPIDLINIDGTVGCLFSSGDRKIVVSAGVCTKQALSELEADVAVMGGGVQILR